jgi:hypothetical protein
MEHGAVVIWYRPGDPVLAGQINQLVRDFGDRCLLAGEFLMMDFEVAATTWGRVLPLPGYEDFQLREFINAFRGEQGPESEICQQGG